MDEIERKFLVAGEPWRGVEGEKLVQVYLRDDDDCSVRVRLGRDRAWLGVKGPRRGITRSEWEYQIPTGDAEELLAEFTGLLRIEKRRYRLAAGDDLCWEIDVFEGANQGLVVAEIELPCEDAEFPYPDWLAEEVTGDKRYGNVDLARNPWPQWPENQA